MFLDYYQILGINTNESIITIKKAFRGLAMQWHPDKNKIPEAKEKFIEINQAYLILSDSKAREKYDLEYEKYYSYQKNRNSVNIYENKESCVFDDEDLCNWINQAKNQADEYSKMKFKEYLFLLKNLGLDFVRTGINSIIYAISNILIISSIGLLIYSFISKQYFLIIVAIIIVFASYEGIKYTEKF
jgi:curved DNA-binding protein CbpA